jgi:hypothetical protein
VFNSSGYDGIRHKFNIQEKFDETGDAKTEKNPSTVPNIPETTDASQSSIGSKPKPSKKYQNAQSSSKTKSFLQEMRKKAKKDDNGDSGVVLLNEPKKNADLPETSSVAESNTGTHGFSEGDVLHHKPEVKDNDEQMVFEAGKTNRKRSQSLTEELGLKFKEEEDHSQEIAPLKTKKISEDESHKKIENSESNQQLKEDALLSDFSEGSPILQPLQHSKVPPPPDIDELKYIMNVPDPDAKKYPSPQISQKLLDKIAKAEKATTGTSVGIQAEAIPLHSAPKKARSPQIEKRISEMVEIDEEQAIKDYFKDGPLVYQLAGVLIHRGGAYGGHYFAYIRSFEDGEWHCFDDSRITKVTKLHVAEQSFGGKTTSESAYMLVYQIVEDIIPNSNWMQIPKELKDACTAELTYEREQSNLL